MAQRISRAKRTVSEAGVDRPGDVLTVLRVLYLVFNEGYSGDVDRGRGDPTDRHWLPWWATPKSHRLLTLTRTSTTPAAAAAPTGRKRRAARWRIGTAASGTPGSSSWESTPHRLRSRDAISAKTRRKRRPDAALHVDAQGRGRPPLGPDRGWYDELLLRSRDADTPIVRHNPAVAVGGSRRAASGQRHWRRSTNPTAAQRGRRVPPREERRSRTLAARLAATRGLATAPQPRRTRPVRRAEAATPT